MARIAQNKLTIKPLTDGKFILSGYVGGKQIRRTNADLGALEALKHSLELSAAKIAAQEAAIQFVKTRLTEAQVREAETAFGLLEGKRHTLTDCILAARAVIGTGEQIDCLDALKQWQAEQRQELISQRTRDNNRARVVSFLEFIGAVRRESGYLLSCGKYLAEIKTESVREWAFLGKDQSPLAAVSRIIPIRAFFNFCLKKKMIGWVPCDIDVAKIVESAGRRGDKKRPHILTPDQCAALLHAAAEYRGGLLLPFTVLQLWCFIRRECVLRLTPEMLRLENKTPAVEVLARKQGTSDYYVDIPANVLPILRKCLERGILAKGERVPYSRYGWDEIRERAGLIKRTGILDRNKRRVQTETHWDDNVLRHTGESFHCQKTGSLKETVEQAGHTQDTARRHYIRLPREGDSEHFYAITLSAAQLAKIEAPARRAKKEKKRAPLALAVAV